MKVYSYKDSNSNSLTEFDLDKPKAERFDLLVEVEAISINPVDIAVRKNIEDNDNHNILGYDGYGTVTEVGEQVTDFKVGDKVFYAGDISRSGSNQEYQLIDSRIVALAPKKTDISDSIGLPLVYMTASELLYEKLGKLKGKTVLIINGAGGVGSITTQLASKEGMTVISTAHGEDKRAWVEKLGADHVVDHYQDLVEQVHELGFEYVDYIIGLSDNTPHFEEIIELIRPFGTFATITSLKNLDLDLLKNKSVNIEYEWMFTKSYFQLDDLMQTQGKYLSKLAEQLDSGEILPITTEVINGIDVEKIKQATKMVEDGHMIGKVVLVK
ncbi:zinc-binding alcohol dehydrogenase family protein [Companilactobacillus metriopterae]|uniref:zinc-binding alcohol dehydrogenase family protein n=1 Tax=Companilactobacillus metriopterae TaxID=1909267 RepID=UPI00100B4AE2|nr:zinc-binding alcohol dehydrogenase family protein [Companilactobacillus metriopterae]